MLGRSKEVSSSPEFSTAEANELAALRKEKFERDAEDRAKEAQRAADKYKNRTWTPEGKQTGVESLVIDGGKLWRINNVFYFQPIHHVTNYVNYGMGNALGALGMQGCSSTSAGNLQRI